LADIQKSTPAAKIDKWRSRCRGAWLSEINGIPVNTIEEATNIFKKAKLYNKDKCTITLAHPEIKSGLTSKGIPQLHIDQLNPKFILNLEHLVKQPVPKMESGGVWHYTFNKLTRGNLIKQDDWHEWQASEWKQLDQYYDQGMFGDPVHVEDQSQVFFLVWTYTISRISIKERKRDVHAMGLHEEEK
jgi:hypothetical protein